MNNKKSVRKDAFHSYFATLLYPLSGMILLEILFTLISLFSWGETIGEWWRKIDDDLYMILICGVSLLLIFVLYHFWNRKRGKEDNAVRESSLPGTHPAGRRMTLRAFLVCFCAACAFDSFSGLLDYPIEAFFNLFGMSAEQQMDLATQITPTVTGVLYGDILAPLFEELVFRGMICKSISKYGKWFAILTSALLFGIMHGNIAQLFSAALLGLILGFLASEYSVGWSILFHMFWNGIWCDLIGSVEDFFPDAVYYSYSWIMAGLGILCLVRYRKKITAYRRENPITVTGLRKWFYTSPWFYILLAYWVYEIISGLTPA